MREELVDVRDRQQQRCFDRLAEHGTGTPNFVQVMLEMWLSFKNDGCAIAPALHIPASDNCLQTNRAPQLLSDVSMFMLPSTLQ